MTTVSFMTAQQYKATLQQDVPSASKLKSLRKEWKDLRLAHSKHLEEEARGQQCGEYEGRKEYIQQSRKILKDTIKTPMLEIGKVLMKHDTPFIQRKVEDFAWCFCNMKWNDDWIEE